MLTMPRRHLRSHWWSGKHQSEGEGLACISHWDTASIVAGLLSFPMSLDTDSSGNPINYQVWFVGLGFFFSL